MPKQYNLGAIFLDADGVLWKDVGPGGILSGKNHAIQNLRLISSNQAEPRLKIVISNQTFAARKSMNFFKFKFYVKSFFSSLIKLELLDDYAICYHHPDANNVFLRRQCECRKPNPGLIYSIAKKYNIDLQKSVLIGDRITDIQAGFAAGIQGLYLLINNGMLEINVNSSDAPMYHIFIPLNELKEITLLQEPTHEN
jgi:D-glycero-D-manno-heptose 1,7-bisphosphate phosphatase